MNQALIDEIRRTTIEIDKELHKIAKGTLSDEHRVPLLLARASCMNAIAMLVAARKRP